jgi:hypothetical protein
MKRPLAIYPVALWSFLTGQLFARSIRGWVDAALPQGNTPDKLGDLLGGCLVIFIFWHTIRLIQLKAFNRWLAVAMFAYCAACMLWHLVVSVPVAPKPLAAGLIFSVVAGLNLLSIWYLTRIEFRKFATTYVATRSQERRARAMQAVSWKKTSSGSRR